MIDLLGNFTIDIEETRIFHLYFYRQNSQKIERRTKIQTQKRPRLMHWLSNMSDCADLESSEYRYPLTLAEIEDLK